MSQDSEKYILIGDPAQLPPTVMSARHEPVALEKSLMERLKDSNPAKDCHLLSIQYRCHPSISRFPSTAFYDSKLENDKSVVNRDDWITQTFPFLQSNHDKLGPVVFFDAENGKEKIMEGEVSCFNDIEAQIAMQLVDLIGNLVDEATFKSGRSLRHNTLFVGVISPYKKQAK